MTANGFAARTASFFMEQRGHARLVALAATLTAGVIAVLLRRGLGAGPDAWATWEASVSILEGDGYMRFLGETIWEWPPLFAYYLAAVQAVLGQTGQALSVAVTVLGGAAVVAWGYYAGGVLPGTGRATLAARLLSMVFLCVFVPQTVFYLSSNLLMIVAAGAALGVFVRMLEAQPTALYLQRGAVLAVLLTASLLSHNSAVAVVAPVTVTLLMASSQPMTPRLIAAAAAAASLAPWILVRWWLVQIQAHVPQTHGHEVLEILVPAWWGTGELLAGLLHLPYSAQAAAGATLWIAVVAAAACGAYAGLRRSQIAMLWMVAATYAVLTAIFIFTWIRDPMQDRFLWLGLLASVPVLLRASAVRVPVLVLASLALLANPAGRTALWGYRGVLAPLADGAADHATVNIHDRYYLSAHHPDQAPPGTVAIFPPTFSWLRRWKDVDLPENDRGRVQVLSGKGGIETLLRPGVAAR